MSDPFNPLGDMFDSFGEALGMKRPAFAGDRGTTAVIRGFVTAAKQDPAQSSNGGRQLLAQTFHLSDAEAMWAWNSL
jgi:hypothetical protein